MLTVSELSMCYRGKDPILENVNLTIPAGRIVPLLGGNGVGKTTLLKLISGIIAPTTGNISICGHDTVTDSAAAKFRIGVSMYPERSFYYRLTCQQNLRYYASLRGIFGAEARCEAHRVLELVDLGEQTTTAFMRLSLGQRKRLGLARAMLGDPQLILLDEPTANLDAESVNRFYDLMSTFAATGAAVLFSTHQMRDLAVASHGFVRIEDRLLITRHAEGEVQLTRWVRVIAPDTNLVDLSSVESRFLVRHYPEGFDVELPVSMPLTTFLSGIADLGVLIERVTDDRWCRAGGPRATELEEVRR